MFLHHFRSPFWLRESFFHPGGENVLFVFLIAFLVILLASTLLFLDLGPWALERSDLTQSGWSGGWQPSGLNQFLKNTGRRGSDVADHGLPESS